MPMQIGAPFQWQDISDLIAVNYPEYTVQTPPTGTPLKLNLSTGSYPGPFFPDMTVFHHVSLAMVCPPNLSVRPMSISGGADTYDLFFEGFISLTPTSFFQGMPLRVPTVWQLFTSTSHGNANAAQADVRGQAVAYQVLHSTLKFCGVFESVYRFVDGFGEHFIAVIRASYRDF